MRNAIKKADDPKSILIRHGTPDNVTLTQVNFVRYATVRENILIIHYWLPIHPYGGEVEICRFHDASIAIEACDLVNQAIREGWEAVDLMLDEKGLISPDARTSINVLTG